MEVKNREMSVLISLLRCDGHVTNLTGESPVVGSYRQA